VVKQLRVRCLQRASVAAQLTTVETARLGSAAKTP